MGDQSNREAHKSRDGYDYQLDQAIVQWLKLGAEGEILMEGIEDFDVSDEQGTLLRQLKKTKEKISLNRKEILETLSLFLDSQKTSIDSNLKLVYSTTGEIASEQNSPFPTKGIIFWQEAKKDLEKAELIRKYLAGLEKAPESLKAFSSRSTAKEFKEALIDPIFWNPLAKTTEELYDFSIELIRDRLEEMTEESDTFLCVNIYHSLFERAARAASGREGDQKEDRKLRRKELREIFEGHTKTSVSNQKLRALEENAQPISNSDGAIVSRAVVVAAVELAGSETSSGLSEVEELLLCGKSREASRKLDSIENGKTWGALSKSLKARLFLQRGRIELNSNGDFEQALSFLERAKEVDPEFDFEEFGARLLAFQGRHEEVLELLENPKNDSERRLKAAALINLNQFLDAQKILVRLEQNAEALRLRCVCDLGLGDLLEAKNRADKAVELHPHWVWTQEIQAMVYYALGSGWSNKPFPLTEFPLPISPLSLPTDTASMGHLSKAQTLFDTLANDCEKDESVTRYRIWSFACLSNHRDLQGEARKSFDDLIRDYHNHPILAIWGASRGLREDWSQQIVFFREQCDLVFNDDYARALSVVYRSRRMFKECQQLLQKYRKQWEDVCSEDWDWNVRQLHIEAGDSGISSVLEESFPDVQFVSNGEVELTDLMKQGSEPIGRSVLNLFLDGKDVEIMESAPAILKEIPSERILEIVAHSFLRNQRWKECSSVIEKHRHVFRGGKFPPEVKRTLVECYEREGNYHMAVDIAKKLFNETKDNRDRSQRDRLNTILGKEADLRASARELVGSSEASPDNLLSIAYPLRRTDKHLAAKLVKKAMHARLTPKQALGAITLISELAIEADTSSLWRQAMQPTESGGYLIEVLEDDDLRQKLKELQGEYTRLHEFYRSAKIPAHVDSRVLRESLRRLLGLQSGVDIVSPFQGCYASRQRAFSSVINSASGLLLLDVTTVVLVERFQLWFVIGDLFKGIQISPRLLPLLTELAGGLGADSQFQDLISGVRKSVSEKLNSKEIQVAEFEPVPDEVDLNRSGIEEYFYVKLGEADFVSVDDRFMTSFRTISSGPQILCFVNLLNLCKEEKALSEEHFFEIRSQLRQDDYRYLPPLAGEVMHAIHKAVKGDQFDPNSMLVRGLCLYMAKCFLDADDLTLSNPQDEGNPDRFEFVFLLSGGGAVGDILSEIWLEENWGLSLKRKVSSWLFEGLLIPPSAIGAIRSNFVAPDEMSKMFNVQILHGAISLVGKNTKEGETILDPFIDWFYSCFGLSIPEVIDLVQELTQRSFKEGLEDCTPSEIKAVENYFWGVILALVNRCPDRQILSEIDPKLIPNRIVSPIQLDDFEFRHEELWDSAAKTFSTTKRVKVRCCSGQTISFDANRDLNEIKVTAEDKHSFSWKEDVFCVVRDDWKDLKPSLILGLVDFDPHAQSEFSDALAECDTGAERYDAFLRFQRLLVGPRVEWIRGALKAGNLTFRDLTPPSAQQIYRYLELEMEPISPVKERLDVGSRALVERVGVVEAFWRYSLLPISMPEGLKESCLSLPAEERRGLLDSFARNGVTLMQLMHFADVFGRFGWNEINFEPVHAVAEVQLFQHALAFSWSSLIAGDEDFSEEVNLVSSWVWAGLLSATMEIQDDDTLSDGIAEMKKSLGSPVFKESLLMKDDVLHPIHFSKGRFLVALVSKIGVRVDDLSAILGDVVAHFEEQNMVLLVYSGYRDLLTNRMGSFLADKLPTNFFTIVAGSSRVAMIADDVRDAEITERLSELTANPKNLSSLLKLCTNLGTGPIPSQWADQIISSLESWEPIDSVSFETDVVLPLKAASWLIRFGSIEALESFDKAAFLLKIANVLAEQSERDVSADFHHLLEIVFQVGFSPKLAEFDYAKSVFGLLFEISESCVFLRERIRGTLARILLHQNSRLGEVGWDQLLRLRLVDDREG